MKTIPSPKSMGEDVTEVDKEIFKVEVFKYVKIRNRLRNNIEKIYTLILGQFTELTCMQIECCQEWEATDDDHDEIKLLKIIKSLAHHVTDQKYYPLSLY